MILNIDNMDVDKLLNCKLINRAEIARKLFPNTDTQYAPTRLADKIREYNGRKITDEDRVAIRKIFADFLIEVGVAE